MKHFVLILLFSVFILNVVGQNRKANKEFEQGLISFEAKAFVIADSLFKLSLHIAPSFDKCVKIANLYLQNNDSCKYCEYLHKSLEYSDNVSSEVYRKDCSQNDTTYYGNSKYSGYVTYLSVISSHRCKDDMRQVFIKKKKYGDIIYMFSYIDIAQSYLKNSKYFPDFNDDIANIIFDRVEVEAKFPGGEYAIYEFLAKNIKYPDNAKVKGSSGRVFVTFIINADGSISNTEILKSVDDKDLDQEALRVINLMPNWSPGKVEGINVRTRYNLPIKFSTTTVR